MPSYGHPPQARKLAWVMVLGGSEFIVGATRRRLEVGGIATFGSPVLDLLAPNLAVPDRDASEEKS